MAGNYKNSDAKSKNKMSVPGLPHLLTIYEILLFLVIFGSCVVVGQDRCSPSVIDCVRDCIKGAPSYQPQRCEECKCESGGINRENNSTGDNRLLRLEGMVSELRTLIIVGVGMGTVVLVVVCCAGLYLLCQYNALPSLPLFLKGKAAKAKAKEAQKTDTKIMMDTTAVRIANYQNKHSPLSKRSSARHPTISSSPGDAQSDVYSGGRRRQPSESSSPDDPTTPTTSSPTSEHPHAYHNRALSTSTLHDTTASSTSTLAPAVSTNTLDTTLASGPANLDNAQGIRI